MAERRGGGGLVVLVVVALAAAGVAWLATTGRLPFVKRALAPIASAVAPVASALGAGTWIPGPAASAPPDAGVPEARPKPTRQTAPLSSAQLGAPLVHGSFIAACGAPDDMKVTVDLSVHKGRAEKVAVKTAPPSPTVAACIEHAVRGLEWDVSPHPGRLTVTY
jgi:hypothetical protein